MKFWLVFLVMVFAAAGGFLVFDYFRPAEKITAGDRPKIRNGVGENKENLVERIRRAEEKSQNVRGVYMTSAVASDLGRPATKLRNNILKLLDETELNGVVIDVKETEGGFIVTDRLRELVADLHRRGVWVVARQVVFKDSSQEKTHPEWYLKRRANGAIWRDRRGGSWLDPASKEIWNYQMSAAKAAADAGFDEIQLDYIRFPSDGNVADIAYPFYDAKKRKKYEVLREFFKYAHNELKKHRPELIISADLFGYVAIQQADLGIGQRLEDIGENFDYVSLMVYPSHYYSGFQAAADPERKLAALYYPYSSKNLPEVVSSQPYDVVYRSLVVARDVLDGKATTTLARNSGEARPGAARNSGAVATSTPSAPVSSPKSRARLRPWLQDFDLAVDANRGINYDAKKVRAQIDAAEAAGASGWLLWSPDNIYTREALLEQTSTNIVD